MSEQTCSACEQLGQVPTPEHLASVAAFAEHAAAVVTVERLERERDAALLRLLEREEAERVRTGRQISTFKRIVAEKQAFAAERDAWKARAERAEALQARVSRLEKMAGKCECMNCIVIGI